MVVGVCLMVTCAACGDLIPEIVLPQKHVDAGGRRPWFCCKEHFRDYRERVNG